VRLPGGDEVPEPDRGVQGGQLHDPVEDQSAARRTAAVEAEDELVQVALQMGLVHPALVSTQQPPLGQRGDPVHGGQKLTGIFAAGAGGPLAAPLVDIAFSGQAVIAHPGVGDHGAARLDGAGDKRVQRLGRGIGQHLHPAPPDPLGRAHLDRDAGEHLLAPGPPAAQPRLVPADERLVRLHRPGQPVPARAHQHRPQPVQHRPRGRVGADLQRPLQALRGDSVLLRGEQPARGEPHRQRRPRPVEDRARRHRGPPLAPRTLIPAIAQPPAPRVPARRAGETARPAQPVQIIQAIGVSAEPGLQLACRPRVVPTRPWMLHRSQVTPVK